MAQKRMFANSVVMTDNFLDMPSSAKCFYFVLGMNADDDGFITSPKAMMRYCGASADDFEILLQKKYLIQFESGVIVLTHWKVNNNVQKDRYKPTLCEEKSMLGIKENGEYYLLQDVDKVEVVQNEIEVMKYNFDDKLETCTEEEKSIVNVYLENYQKLYQAKIINNQKPIIEWNECIERLKKMVEEFGSEIILQAVQKSIRNQFCIKTGYSLYKILSTSVLSELVNVTEKKVENVENIEDKIKDEKRKAIINAHPKTCKCGKELFDSSFGWGSSWMCKSCEREYVIKDDKWVEKYSMEEVKKGA